MIVVSKTYQHDSEELAARKRRYNKVLSSGRIQVEQTIGSVKSRFPILLDRFRGKRNTLCLMLYACCALHNFWMDSGEGLVPWEELHEQYLRELGHAEGDVGDGADGEDVVEDLST